MSAERMIATAIQEQPIFLLPLFVLVLFLVSVGSRLTHSFRRFLA